MNTKSVEARDELIKRLHTELVGPSYIEEVIKTKPLQKYLCGILWPQNSSLAKEEDELTVLEGKETNKEEVESLAPLAKAMNPSAVGLSFLIDKLSAKVVLDVHFGMYQELGDKEHWERKVYKLEKHEIDFSIGVGKKQKAAIPNTTNIYLEWLVRPFGDTFAISMFLVNRNIQEPDEHDIDFKCIFQPEIIVESLESQSFVVRHAFSDSNDEYRDADTRSNDLLYRNETVFAVGHSISVTWENLSSDSRRAGKLITNIIPTYEIPMVIPPDWDKGGTLDMKKLAKLKDGEEIKAALSPLCDEYETWILERENEILHVDEVYKEIASEHMRKCRESLSRIRNGINLITSDKTILKAFRFANEAMARQRSQSIFALNKIPPEEVKAVWRPFQIAFILQNLEGTVDPESSDRQLADLLWFPTGGGKTEAYLGLAAFTMGYRRIREKHGLRTDVGVSVIMRYTLRLLTIQQFQRASALICACESIRKLAPNLLGNTPFRIGLWVGKKSVPNDFDDALETLEALRARALGRNDIHIDQSKGSPIQLVSCPWCGESLFDEDNPRVFLKTYRADKKKRRLYIRCTNKNCEFHSTNTLEGIPVVVTDEEIYRLLPDMLIGTVDKFAQMPWKPEIQNLFGKVKGEVKDWGFVSNGDTSKESDNIKNVAGTLSIMNSTEVQPPDLIIQDELHLISGPLGTMVGLYETAIDYLCSTEINGVKIGPKIVASTATIRNAHQQIQGLFNRKAQIFPSPGLSHKDSFFAKQRTLEDTPGRTYVGIFAPGRSMKTALLRTYANLLASTPIMEGTYSNESLDPYQTLVGYFNSLRELGGAVRLIEDDVPSRMKTLEKQNDDGQLFLYKKRDYSRDVPELTSRIDSSEIPKILKRLEQPFDKSSSSNPVDVLLASNMISVGVDVSRLGLMVVNGQPKTTAEYIQSTSRVGRSHPGLVLTLYNWIRPRDISHYEEFYAYHAALYRYVEPISVTPFSSRARDRGLAGATVSMARLGYASLTKNNSPANFLDDLTISEELQQFLLDRVRSINSPENELLHDLQKLYLTWEDAIEKSKLLYNFKRRKEDSNLLYPLGQKKTGYFKTPNSMRDVEATAGIYLRRD
ncbi:DISARM system helicase DrmA [Priestia megaterium]|uniref:DISARM system helicase DrmA n=1 Tax=Priestia megaterium TaxID=1404 RepID=UPI00267748C7|nr:DISARM system helicase DrmA [Priestia megaterium]WKU21122.1 DISARM system helicase DrmA [Priestia megaterium]